MGGGANPGAREIKVETHRTSSQRVLQRVMQEVQANIKNADAVHKRFVEFFGA